MGSYNQLKIRVPAIAPRKKWLSFVEEETARCIKYRGKITHASFSFSNQSNLNTNQLVTLACLVEWYYVNGFEIHFYGGTDSLKHFLTKIRFKEYWQHDFDRTKFTPIKNSTTFCLWNITPDFFESYSIEATRYYEALFNNSKDLTMLKTSLNEVFNNIFDHSESLVNGYIITQYYPNKQRLSFSCCDLGIGICQKVKRYLDDDNMSDFNALKKALTPSFSTKSVPRNKGVGLENLKDFARANNGELKIYSNSVMYHLTPLKETIYTLSPYNFKGTLIQVDVGTDKFEPKDIEGVDF